MAGIGSSESRRAKCTECAGYRVGVAAGPVDNPWSGESVPDLRFLVSLAARFIDTVADRFLIV